MSGAIPLAGDFTAAAIIAGVAALTAVIMRDLVIGFQRREFGPSLRRMTDTQIWTMGVAGAALFGFLSALPAGAIYRALDGDPIFWAAACLGGAALATLACGAVFRGWWGVFTTFYFLVWTACGVLHPYLNGAFSGLR